MSYQIALDAFQGPLDLLLYLVKKQEVDILDIPLAIITEQFLDYLNLMQLLDVELAGDFIVMASTLMEVKSRMLLPDETEEESEPGADPRRELVRQLIEYRKFKDAATLLEDQAESQAYRYARETPLEPAGARGVLPVRPVELWDLVSAFGRMMRETLALQPKQIRVDDTPQHVYESRIRARLQSGKPVEFRVLFTLPFDHPQLVGMFLAMLELIKERVILLQQAILYGEIWVQLKDQNDSL